ncbi:LPXTG cell wall anchor domain-containing protein, partial [Lapidilactobacillus dextrinicus]
EEINEAGGTYTITIGNKLTGAVKIVDQDGKQLGDLYGIFGNKGTVLTDSDGWNSVEDMLESLYNDGYSLVNSSDLSVVMSESGKQYIIRVEKVLKDDSKPSIPNESESEDNNTNVDVSDETTNRPNLGGNSILENHSEKDSSVTVNSRDDSVKINTKKMINNILEETKNEKKVVKEQGKLPQTGENQNSKLITMAGVFLLITSFLGTILTKLRKKNS